MAGTVERLDLLVDRWVEEGVITTAQAERMHAEVAALAAPEPVPEPVPGPGGARGSSVLDEALGYLGGSIVLVGSVLIGSWYWHELGTAVRLAVLFGAALLLLAAGAAVPASRSLETAAGRLRSVLWLTSTGAVAGALAVLSADVLTTTDKRSFAVVAVGTAGYAAALRLVGGVVQQAAMVVTLALAAASLVNLTEAPQFVVGLAAWTVGVAWAVLGGFEAARPGRVAVVLGSAVATVAAMSAGGSNQGTALTLATVVAVVVAAVVLRDLLLLGLGTVGALVNTPVAMTRWFPDSVAAAFALVLVGALLLAVAVRVAHARGDEGPVSGARSRPGGRRPRPPAPPRSGRAPRPGH